MSSLQRCRCSHLPVQHYRTRRGRPMCVGTCGCAGYAPPDGGLQTPVGVTPADARRAAVVLCSAATDAAEARTLLAMCGLLPDPQEHTP